jgi:hypothetical protein
MEHYDERGRPVAKDRGADLIMIGFAVAFIILCLMFGLTLGDLF